MNNSYDRIQGCVDAIREITDFKPRVALVLGSGLGGFAEKIDKVATVPYSAIPSFPLSTVSGHKGQFVFGYVENTPVVIMQGRVHYYEGYSMFDVVLPIRIMKLLGAEILILTNSAGGLNAELEAGSLMLITGHISSFVPSPLIGDNIEELGVRFPDMTNVYDKELNSRIRTIAQKAEIPLSEGVYVQASGPNYETAEEVQMFFRLGGDAVGMSTACEAMAARHCGMRVCGISCISNMATGISPTPLSHEEVKAAGERMSRPFTTLVYELIKGC